MAVYRWWAIALAFAGALLVMQSGASADQRKDTGHSDALEHATVSGNAFSGTRGSIKVNETAGNGNAQANVMVVTTSPAAIELHQSTAIGMKESGDAFITGNAFSGAFGAIQFNQSAGSGNAQGNLIVMELGSNATALSDTALSQNVSSNSGRGRDPSFRGGSSVYASHDAFSQSGGVVQVNQAAGSSNQTVNSFQLQLQTGP